MSNNNEGKVKKKCPFLGEGCIEGACALWIEIIQQQLILGLMKQVKGGACCFPSLAMIMSNRPAAPMGMQKIDLPKLKG